MIAEDCFIHFDSDIADIPLPDKFTFPFYYEPHPLSVMAANQLQHYLKTQKDWQHNFGLDPEDKSSVIGKMFGVLVVQKTSGELGFLAAFSGKLAESNHHKYFVPPVFDMLHENSFFNQKSEVVNAINRKIEALEQHPNYLIYKENFLQLEKDTQAELLERKQILNQAKKERKAIRNSAVQEMSPSAFEELKEVHTKESLQQQFFFREITQHLNDKLAKAKALYDDFENQIKALKQERKDKSNALQQELFEQYTFLNATGQPKSLYEIFNKDHGIQPPAGSGECAAPKLLQYAFLHHLKPVALAEFWWGDPPKSEVRAHGLFYPACRGKCEPILKHMLDGVVMDDNPMEQNFAIDKVIEILYEDDYLLAIHKPHELLSVPGINVQDSVYTRMQVKYPNATGPLIVHRLDMNTSGIMLIAKNKDIHKQLQGQFIKRKVKKEYTAILEGILKQEKGSIDLPLRVDLEDRPRQLVCYEHGKPAQTQWEVIAQSSQHTKIRFFPITGRTHQLRVHAAHPQGLNTPILGDDLYGNKGVRLHLHASKLTFQHPITKEIMVIEKREDFDL
jgi:tRNA pseudouridine32 synthase/23S rRNA pseudouridine746 synthase